MTAELRWTDLEQIEENFFQTIAETVPIMTWVSAADTRRIYISPQWLEFIGRTIAQELAREWAQGVHPDDHQQCVDTYRGAFRAPQSFQIEYRLRRADGQYRWLLERGVPWFSKDGVFSGFMGFCVDITDPRRRDEVLQAEHDELKQLVQERTKALSIASARLQEDITAQKLTEHSLVEQQAQLRMLASEVTVAQERERRRIAVGLHDEIGQVLALARLKIGELLEAQTAGRNLGLLENINELLGQAAKATRSATFELSSPVLHEIGLEAALQRLGDECQKRDGIRFDFKPHHPVTALTDRTRIVVYRAVRELFFNIEKHAQAHHVTLSVRKAGQYLQFSVEDDGVGTDTTCIGHGFGSAGGFGLFSIREQITGIGGRLEIVSSLGAGTRVVVAVPLG
jgi:PAS domain S-box-containing protein